ncbi:hypothetical protein VTK73DRAFT_5302 [Phialemonium thermophilum]|uniref:Uncharacterized protein n=1 Tax=Phialemonium thermophilum TaxID=223376 RepID=A0ABR3V296_9PEZI
MGCCESTSGLVRFFLVARGGRDGCWAPDDGRLVFSAGMPRWRGGPWEGEDDDEEERGRDDGLPAAVAAAAAAADDEGRPEAAAGGGAMSSDSGTSRNSIGCEAGRTPAPRPEGPATADGPSSSCSFLGRPRAAAAQERRVVREARRAASLSAW